MSHFPDTRGPYNRYEIILAEPNFPSRILSLLSFVLPMPSSPNHVKPVAFLNDWILYPPGIAQIPPAIPETPPVSETSNAGNIHNY